MPRSIEWTKTGGKTHRVTITEPVSELPLALRNYQYLAQNQTPSYIGAENCYMSALWQQNQQQAMSANPDIAAQYAMGVYQSGLNGRRGLFDGLFGGLG